MPIVLIKLAWLGLEVLGQAAGQGPNPPAGAGGDGSGSILWAVLLIGAAAALFMVEIFIPSGGIIGLVAGIALVGGIVLLFMNSATIGLIGAAVTLLGLPFLIGFALKIWPDTPIGRLFVLADGSSKAAGGGTSEDAEPGRTDPDPEVSLQPGTEGKALTDLHPVGTCLLNAKREQCLASGGQIDAGQTVRVVAADGMQIKVQAIRR